MRASETTTVTAALLEALCNAWLVSQTAIEIGSDLEKISLLRAAARELNLSEGELPQVVTQLYVQVFLRPFAEVASGRDY